MDVLTHAITVHQPYAWALACGHKPVENRTWRPGLEHIGTLVGIHAGTSSDGFQENSRAVRCAMGRVAVDLPTDPTMVFGALVGVARLVGVVRRRKVSASEAHEYELLQGRGDVAVLLSTPLCERVRPWWRGPWGWLFEEAVLLSEPIPLRGQQGLWRIPQASPAHREGDHRSCAAWALEQWRKARARRDPHQH